MDSRVESTSLNISDTVSIQGKRLGWNETLGIIQGSFVSSRTRIARQIGFVSAVGMAVAALCFKYAENRESSLKDSVAFLSFKTGVYALLSLATASSMGVMIKDAWENIGRRQTRRDQEAREDFKSDLESYLRSGFEGTNRQIESLNRQVNDTITNQMSNRNQDPQNLKDFLLRLINNNGEVISRNTTANSLNSNRIRENEQRLRAISEELLIINSYIGLLDRRVESNEETINDFESRINYIEGYIPNQ